MERDFKGIWIPKELWLDKGLTIQEKIFLVEIISLDNEEGCYATNTYFAEFFGIGKNRVSIVINSLVKKGYITSLLIYKEGTKQILKRVLKESHGGYHMKVIDPIIEKCEDNNIYNNTVNKEILVQFEIFWKQYNKKKAKKKCLAKWKLLKASDRNKIMEVLGSYLKMESNIKYRPHPLTFLNGELWNDEIIIDDINGSKPIDNRPISKVVIGYDKRRRPIYEK